MARLSLWIHPRFALHLGEDIQFFFLCFLSLPPLSSNKCLKIIIFIQHLITWTLISILLGVLLWWACGALSWSLAFLNCTLPHEWACVKAEHPSKVLEGLTHMLQRGFFPFCVLCHSASPKCFQASLQPLQPWLWSLQVQQSFWGLAFVLWQKKSDWFLERFWALDKKERDSLQL